MTKAPTFNEADLAIGRHVLQSLERERRGLDEIGKLLGWLENHDQVLRERRRRLEILNAEIAQREAHTIDSAESEGKRRADKITADAKLRSNALVAEARAKVDEMATAVIAKRSELDDLNAKIAAAKSSIQAVLSAT